MNLELDPTMIPAEVVEVCHRLTHAGHRAWVVGGCVRDLLMGRTINDWDICTSAVPEQTKKLFRKVVPTGLQHGTVTVIWKGEHYEVTTLRGEGAYTDGRRPDEVFFVRDIEEDLARRDFTVNAIAYDPFHNELVDPHGGLVDLEARLIRAVGVPAERFAEDGLRILRGARFVGTLHFELEQETEAAFSGALETFAKVSHERVREEWMKAMKADRPSLAFEVMERTGILAKSCPLLAATAGFERDSWNGRDAFRIALDALDASEGAPEERLASLLHGVGRPRADDETYARTSADLIEGWLSEYRFSRDEKRTITHLIRHHRVAHAGAWLPVDVRRFMQRAEKTKVDAVLRVAEWVADSEGLPRHVPGLRARVDKELAEGSATTVGELEISGEDVKTVLGTGGRAVGEILRAVLERVIEDPALNERRSLRELVDELADAYR